MSNDKTKFGFVALVGRPNVGKSTLLNHFVGAKLAITSRKPNTTRDRLLGVLTRNGTQIGFLDTPGIGPKHRGSSRAINRYMRQQALGVLENVDIAIQVVDARGWRSGDDEVCEVLQTSQLNTCICAINKIDLLFDRNKLLPLMAQVNQKRDFKAIVPISALKKKGLDPLLDEICNRLPTGKHAFDPSELTDRSERYLVSEIVREKITRRLGDELPHRIAVVVEEFTRADERIHVSAVIYVERQGQKAILLGRGGERIKSVGIEARKSMEELLELSVALQLWVKVRPGWSGREEQIVAMGYR